MQQKLSKNNTTGVKGVVYAPKEGRYRAQIVFQQKTYHLGSYKTIGEAAKARRQGEEEYYEPILEKYNRV